MQRDDHLVRQGPPATRSVRRGPLRHRLRWRQDKFPDLSEDNRERFRGYRNRRTSQESLPSRLISPALRELGRERVGVPSGSDVRRRSNVA